MSQRLACMPPNDTVRTSLSQDKNSNTGINISGNHIWYIEELATDIKAAKEVIARQLKSLVAEHLNNVEIGKQQPKIIVSEENLTSKQNYLLFEGIPEFFVHPSPNKFEIQYESVVERPAQSLEELCRFVSVPYEEGMLDYAHNESLLSQHQSSALGDTRCALLHSTRNPLVSGPKSCPARASAAGRCDRIRCDSTHGLRRRDRSIAVAWRAGAA